jgi:hypothetical protein
MKLRCRLKISLRALLLCCFWWLIKSACRKSSPHGGPFCTWTGRSEHQHSCRGGTILQGLKLAGLMLVVRHDKIPKHAPRSLVSHLSSSDEMATCNSERQHHTLIVGFRKSNNTQTVFMPGLERCIPSRRPHTICETHKLHFPETGTRRSLSHWRHSSRNRV